MASQYCTFRLGGHLFGSATNVVVRAADGESVA